MIGLLIAPSSYASLKSFDKTKNIGKEYIGADTQITYDLVVSDGVIHFSSEFRSWNIDRFTGVSNLSHKNADGSFR